jgi:hypothetical protein
MLNDDYRRVAIRDALAQENTSQAAPHALVHALWCGEAGRWPDDKTMCGQVDSLDVTNVGKYRIVSCADCLKALKRERQRRSAEGTIRHQERMREQRAEVQQAMQDAGYEAAGPDMVYVPNEEIDRIVMKTLSMRSAALREQGFDDLADDIDIFVGRFSRHYDELPADDTSMPKDQHDALTQNRPERRLRPRLIHPTPPTPEGDEL